MFKPSRALASMLASLFLAMPPVPGEEVVLNIPAFRADLYQAGALTKSFTVSIGRLQHQTPVGEFTIVAKAANPWWQPVGGGPAVPPGPDNALGDYWMALSFGRYGLHGTNRPDTIGGMASGGCIRFTNADASEVFRSVTLGSSVRIVYEPFEFRPGPDGRTMMHLYPDIYQKGLDSWERFMALVTALGYVQRLQPSEWERLYRESRRRPLQVDLGLGMVFNGDTVPGRAVRTDDGVLIPLLPVAAALGLAAGWSARSRAAVVDGRVVAGVLSDGTAMLRPETLAQVLGLDLGYELVGDTVRLSATVVSAGNVRLGDAGFVDGEALCAPVRHVAEALGYRVHWEPATGRFSVDDRDLPVVYRQGKACARAQDCPGWAVFCVQQDA
ncbi:MAG: L,D-transpeptidase family protein [Bacillota bacterium]